ncbi:MAG TPA: nicotinate-nucleotide adenylyltransferase [Candidatus Polarisedimenticolaceae bacterium]|nr:nicotinate-nucleotide adenylyltransferase [Candidatus Polarisedimenticolaceae bacterium]
MSAIGVLGGSFDPVHRGHVELATRAALALSLDAVVLLPCAAPPHKPERVLAAAYHRLEMLYLAVEGRERLGVSTLEIAQGGVRYTIDSLRALRHASPSRPPIFLIGSDALAEIRSWRDYDALLEEFDLATATRNDGDEAVRRGGWPEVVSRRETTAVSGLRVGAGGRVFKLEMALPEVSSSLVRRRRAAGEPVDDLVPARIARYIQRHGLYSREGCR